MGKMVIAAYRAKPGQEAALIEMSKEHVPILRKEGLATDRACILMQSRDGTIVEVFEWVSEEAIQNAHTNPAVLKMWAEYEAVCDYVKVADVAECNDPWAMFEPLDL